MAHFTTTDGLKLYYSDEGAGLPLLCLSGLTRNGQDFSYVTPHLDGVRMIKLDYRGRGRSDWAEDALSYTVPREAADVLELLDHLGLDRVAVLGTSRGGLVAMMLGYNAKDRLRGVAFNDIGPELDPRGLEAIMSYLGRPPAWTSHEEAVAARPTAMAGFANVPESRWREEVQKLYRETDEGLALTYDPRLRDAVEAAGAEGAPDLWPLFDALEGLPIAVIRGANSDLLSRETVSEMKRRRPDMLNAEVPDRGHIPFLDEPEAVRVLHDWLDLMQ